MLFKNIQHTHQIIQDHNTILFWIIIWHNIKSNHLKWHEHNRTYQLHITAYFVTDDMSPSLDIGSPSDQPCAKRRIEAGVGRELGVTYTVMRTCCYHGVRDVTDAGGATPAPGFKRACAGYDRLATYVVHLPHCFPM